MAIHSILATEVLAASVATMTGRKIFEHYILKGLSAHITIIALVCFVLTVCRANVIVLISFVTLWILFSTLKNDEKESRASADSSEGQGLLRGGGPVSVIARKPSCWDSVRHLETRALASVHQFLEHNHRRGAPDEARETEHVRAHLQSDISLHASMSQRECFKYCRDRGLETWKVLIECLPPQGFSSSHSLPGHMLGILRGWAWLCEEGGWRLETLSSIRSPAPSVAGTVWQSWAQHEGAEVIWQKQKTVPLATYPIVYVNPKSVALSVHKQLSSFC